MKNNMVWKRFPKTVLVLLLGLLKISFGQECDTNGINCISCTEYRTCTGGIPQDGIISCKRGNVCADEKLKQCQTTLNCQALNECMEAGIFPDVMDDSNYFVCLPDGSDGFLKHDFTCQEDNFFDESTVSCIPRDATPVDPAADDVTSTTITSQDTTTPLDTTTSAVSTTPSDTTTSSVTTTSSDTTTSSVSTTPSDTTTSSVSTTPSDTTTSSITTTPSDTTTSSVTTTPSDTTTTSSVSTTPSDTTTSSVTTTPSDTTTSSITTTPSDTTTSSVTSTPSDTTTSSVTTTPSDTTTSSPTTPTPQFVCPSSGIFPSPDNCKIYYRCSTSLKSFLYICPGRSYFNENILKCSLVISPACQEQILRNSSSTLPPVTPFTTTTVKTTTPTTPPTMKTTTSTTSTSTTQSPSVPFLCPMPGTFESPTDCKTYYRCFTSGKFTRYECPGSTYFNEITKRCSLTPTPRCNQF